jgi:Capsule assembly protein Wzi
MPHPFPGNTRNSSNMASTYVPLDSWVYPTLGRFEALGYLQTGFLGLRPWTRLECTRLLMEIDELSGGELPPNLERQHRDLAVEFAPELKRLESDTSKSAELESAYYRGTWIAGIPLSDGYHFAQTLTNNFGRPYGEGDNLYVGGATRAAVSIFAFYVSGEYQGSAPGITLSPSAQQAIAQADFSPTAAAGPASGTSRFEFLDTYVAVNFKNNQLSFGKQSLWWGPEYGGPLLFSDNAPPVTMLKYDRVKPFKLPSFLGVLGPIRMQFFIGQLSGQQFVHIPTGTVGHSGVSLNPQPYTNGLKFSLKPTPDFEFSVSRTAIFGGPGFPVTLHSFWRSLVSTGNSADFNDPGDRRVAFDVTYRIPELRDWLTFYCDAFSDDEAFPIAYPTHSAWQPGIYLPKLPGLPKLDFRAEGAITPERLFPGFFYFNVHYLSGYTNDRQLLGSSIGRQGSGFQLWSTYWFSGRTTIQASYRSASVDRSFLQGGYTKDASLTAQVPVRPDLLLSAAVQYERWRFPLISAAATTDVSTSVQLTFTPEWSRR